MKKLLIGVALLLPLFINAQVADHGLVKVITNWTCVKIGETDPVVLFETTKFTINLHTSTLEIMSENGDKEVYVVSIKMDDRGVWILEDENERVYALTTFPYRAEIYPSSGVGWSKYY